MDVSATKLEESAQEMRDKLVRIEAKLENFEKNYASKADLHHEIGSQTWKIISFVTGLCTALVAATFFIARTIH